MKKEIRIQYQGLAASAILQKEVGFIALNFDNIRLVIDAYNGFPCLEQPREDSVIEISDANEVFQMDVATLMTAIKFYWCYSEQGESVQRHKNRFNMVMPDMYKNACIASRKAKIGLKI